MTPILKKRENAQTFGPLFHVTNIKNHFHMDGMVFWWFFIDCKFVFIIAFIPSSINGIYKCS